MEHMDRDSKAKNAPRRSLTSAVDLVHLRYAVAAADHGSFRRAAEALLLQQTKLSRCIRQLEERIEMIVFERSSGGVRATPAGRDFLRMARSILEQMDTLMASAHSAGRGEAGRLAIGFYGSRRARLRGRPDRQRHRHVQAERRALHALQGSDAGRGPRAKAASAGLEGGLDRERLDGYITAARRLIWKTPWRSWKTSEKSAVKSSASMGNGVTVAQQTLTLFV